MMLRYLILLLLGSATALAAESVPQNAKTLPLTAERPIKQIFLDHLSGSISFTNNYIFRGISQTNNNPALQAGVNYDFAVLGLYAYAWGSNVDFKTAQEKKVATEIDASIGSKNSITDNLSYDVALQRYNYPSGHSEDYVEAYGNLTYYFLTALVAYSANEFNSHTSGTYYNLSAEYTIPCHIIHTPDVSIGAGIGHFTLQPAAGKSYNDFSLQISKMIKPITFALQWTDTNRHYSQDALDKAHWVASITMDI